MNNKEKAVLYFLIISLVIGSVISLYKREKEKQNIMTISMEMNSGEKHDTTIIGKAENKRKKEKMKSELVDINQATAKELEALPGIGPVLALRIIEERNRKGKFLAPEDLLKVKGIGKKKLEEIKDKIKIAN